MSFIEQLEDGKFEPLEWPKDWTISYGSVTKLPLNWIADDLRANGTIISLQARAGRDSDTALFDFIVDPDPDIGDIDEARSEALAGLKEVFLTARAEVQGPTVKQYLIVQGYVPVKAYSGTLPTVVTPVELSDLLQAISDFNQLDTTPLMTVTDNIGVLQDLHDDLPELNDVHLALPEIIQANDNEANINAAVANESNINLAAQIDGDDVAAVAAIDDDVTALGGYLQNQSTLSSKISNLQIVASTPTNLEISFDSLTLLPIDPAADSVSEFNVSISIDQTNFLNEVVPVSNAISDEWCDIIFYKMSDSSLKVGFLSQSDTLVHPNNATHFFKYGSIYCRYQSGQGNTAFFLIREDHIFIRNRIYIPSVTTENIQREAFNTNQIAVQSDGSSALSLVGVPTGANAIRALVEISFDINDENSVFDFISFNNIVYEVKHSIESAPNKYSIVLEIPLIKGQASIPVAYNSNSSSTSVQLTIRIMSFVLDEPFVTQDIGSGQQLRDTLAAMITGGSHQNLTPTYNSGSGTLDLNVGASSNGFKDASFGDGSNGYTELIGDVDGVNKTFFTSQPYTAGKLEVSSDRLNYRNLAGITETDPATNRFDFDVAPTHYVIAEER